MSKNNIEINADIRNKLQPEKTALEKIRKGEKVSDEFILTAIRELNEANKLLKRKQIKIIRNKLFLLLPEKTQKSNQCWLNQKKNKVEC